MTNTGAFLHLPKPNGERFHAGKIRAVIYQKKSQRKSVDPGLIPWFRWGCGVQGANQRGRINTDEEEKHLFRRTRCISADADRRRCICCSWTVWDLRVSIGLSWWRGGSGASFIWFQSNACSQHHPDASIQPNASDSLNRSRLPLRHQHHLSIFLMHKEFKIHANERTLDCSRRAWSDILYGFFGKPPRWEVISVIHK